MLCASLFWEMYLCLPSGARVHLQPLCWGSVCSQHGFRSTRCSSESSLAAGWAWIRWWQGPRAAFQQRAQPRAREQAKSPSVLAEQAQFFYRSWTIGWTLKPHLVFQGVNENLCHPQSRHQWGSNAGSPVTLSPPVLFQGRWNAIPLLWVTAFALTWCLYLYSWSSCNLCHNTL